MTILIMNDNDNDNNDMIILIVIELSSCRISFLPQLYLSLSIGRSIDFSISIDMNHKSKYY